MKCPFCGKDVEISLVAAGASNVGTQTNISSNGKIEHAQLKKTEKGRPYFEHGGKKYFVSNKYGFQYFLARKEGDNWKYTYSTEQFKTIEELYQHILTIK